MNRPDELEREDDRDGDGTPDRHETAEAVKDVLDAFKTANVGKDMGVGGIGATPDDEHDE